MPYSSYRYKNRTSGPMSMDGGNFYAHTFMAEERQTISYEATSCFLASQDMMGLFDDNGNPGEYESASYSALQYMDRGIMVFSGEEIKKPDFISEENIGRGVASIIA